MTKQIVQGMITRKSGKIINICSLMCEMGRPTVGGYTAAKGGVNRWDNWVKSDIH